MRFVTTANNSVPVFSTGGFAVSLFSDMTSASKQASKPLFINKGLLSSDRNLFGRPFHTLFFPMMGLCRRHMGIHVLCREIQILDYRGFAFLRIIKHTEE